MKTQRVREILDRIKNVKIAVYGDFCLDAYWILSPAAPRSPSRPASRPRPSPATIIL